MLQLFLFISLFAFHHAKVQGDGKTPAILFESVYANYHSGIEIKGVIIDTEGKVHSFNSKNKNTTNKFPDWRFGKFDPVNQTYELTSKEAQENLSKCDSIICTIPPEWLKKYADMLTSIHESQAPLSKIVDIKTSGRGMTYFFGFIYDGKKDTYTKILIEKHGGIEQHNTSTLTRQLLQWKWCK